MAVIFALKSTIQRVIFTYLLLLILGLPFALLCHVHGLSTRTEGRYRRHQGAGNIANRARGRGGWGGRGGLGGGYHRVGAGGGGDGGRVGRAGASAGGHVSGAGGGAGGRVGGASGVGGGRGCSGQRDVFVGGGAAIIGQYLLHKFSGTTSPLNGLCNPNKEELAGEEREEDGEEDAEQPQAK